MNDLSGNKPALGLLEKVKKIMEITEKLSDVKFLTLKIFIVKIYASNR